MCAHAGPSSSALGHAGTPLSSRKWRLPSLPLSADGRCTPRHRTAHHPCGERHRSPPMTHHSDITAGATSAARRSARPRPPRAAASCRPRRVKPAVRPGGRATAASARSVTEATAVHCAQRPHSARKPSHLPTIAREQPSVCRLVYSHILSSISQTCVPSGPLTGAQATAAIDSLSKMMVQELGSASGHTSRWTACCSAAQHQQTRRHRRR